jgi:hypothetical protein
MFFTLAGNIIWTYVLPALVPAIVLCADALAAACARGRSWRVAALAVPAASALALVAALAFWAPRHAGSHSSATILPAWQDRDHPQADTLTYVGRRAPASLRFYSRGAVRAVPGVPQALVGLAPGQDCYVAVAPADAEAARRSIAALAPLASVETVGANQDLVLLRVSEDGPPSTQSARM